MRSFLAVSVLSIAIAPPSLGATIHVPGDYPTIQEAVNAASSGDSVLVAEGTYALEPNSPIVVQGSISLVSEGGAESTIIDGQGESGCLVLYGEEPGIVVHGFTLTGSNTGAIHLRDNCTIRDCIIRDCYAQEGGGVWVRGVNHTMEACTIRDCSASQSGGGIFVDRWAELSLDGCLVANNACWGAGGGILADGGAVLEVLSSRIVGNLSTDDGGGLNLNSWNTVTIASTLISGNVASGNGGGISSGPYSETAIEQSTVAANRALGLGGAAFGRETAFISIDRSVLWGNCDPLGTEIHAFDGRTRVSVGCSVINLSSASGLGQVEEHDENLPSDPFFCNPPQCEDALTTHDDFSVRSDSPCLPSNNVCGVLIGAFDQGCLDPSSVPDDSGAAIVRLSWGLVKRQFKSP